MPYAEAKEPLRDRTDFKAERGHGSQAESKSSSSLQEDQAERDFRREVDDAEVAVLHPRDRGMSLRVASRTNGSRPAMIISTRPANSQPSANAIAAMVITGEEQKTPAEEGKTENTPSPLDVPHVNPSDVVMQNIRGEQGFTEGKDGECSAANETKTENPPLSTPLDAPQRIDQEEDKEEKLIIEPDEEYNSIEIVPPKQAPPFPTRNMFLVSTYIGERPLFGNCWSINKDDKECLITSEGVMYLPIPVIPVSEDKAESKGDERDSKDGKDGKQDKNDVDSAKGEDKRFAEAKEMVTSRPRWKDDEKDTFSVRRVIESK